MALNPTLSRRRLLQAGAGAAAVTALAGLPVTAFAAPKAGKGNGRLIPAGKVGTITFTQRDVPGRIGIAGSAALGQSPTMGYLGGDNFPEDPNDLGPLVPLPGGWRELFEYLANAGFAQIEFAGYGQNANNPGGTASPIVPGSGAGGSPGVVTPETRAAYLAYAHTLRGFLDEFGLEAIGSHGFIPNTWFGPGSANGTMSDADYTRFQLELEFASILGMPYMGTGSDPASANNRNIEPWTVAGEKWEALNTLAISDWGIRIYPHNHSPAYNFLQDGPMVEVTVDRVTGNPLPAPVVVRGESGKRLMEYYLEITDPELCHIELDIYWAHVAQHQHRWYFDHNGQRRERIFEPLELVQAQPIRVPLYHAKDGARTTDAPGVGSGYAIVPFGAGNIDFHTFLKDDGPRGYPNANYEQDNAGGGSADPGRSLRNSTFSARNMNALRG
jgi:sugar phosphate isomerase/epimerase